MTQPNYCDVRDAMIVKDGIWTAAISENWRQGRTAYGGITTALAYHVAQSAFEDLSPLRSLHINFTGPVGESAEFRPEILRQGRNVTTIAVHVTSQDSVCALAIFTFGLSRDSAVIISADRDEAVKSPEQSESFFPQGFDKNLLPGFLKNFEMKLHAGGRPTTGQDEAFVEIWARHDDAAAHKDIGALVCIGDILPPGVLVTLNQFAPVSSMNWTVNFTHDAPKTRDGWWRLSCRARQCENGYSSQDMLIWNTDGELIGHAMQSVAVFV